METGTLQNVEERSARNGDKPEGNGRRGRGIAIAAVVAGLIVLGLVVAAVIFLLQPATPTERIRDIFIILMGLVSVLVGMAAVVMIVQLAVLINLLQNEVRPILRSTTETVNTVRGTTVFVSDNVVEPIIKVNSYLAAARNLLDFRNIWRR